MAEFTTFATWKCEICSRPLGEHEGHELRDCNLKLWQLQKAAPAMYEALKRIMALDDSGALEAVAYSGGDIPKKWMREEAPAIDARSKARKEIQDIIRPIIALAEGRTP